MTRLSSLVLSTLVLFACTSTYQKSIISSNSTSRSTLVEPINEGRADKERWLSWQADYDKSRRSKTGWLSLEAVSYGKDNPMTLMFVDETDQETTFATCPLPPDKIDWT